MIPYGRQSISEDDIAAVVDVLRSDFLTQGPVIEQFEKAVCECVNARFAVAVSNGTAALHIACRALGLGKGDNLWTSPITFVASANCALYCGANVDFVDIDTRTFNMSVEALEKKLRQAKDYNKLPKVVVPVHLAGLSCDMEAIARLSKQYGFSIIEDASHAIGGRYKNTEIGCCQFSDITIFSFHPVKIITTGEGGMAVSNNRALVEKMRLLRTHGITRDPDYMTHALDGAWYYQQIDLGFNYRITDFQAALGISQLKRLDKFVKRRHELAARYDTLLSGLPVSPQFRPDTCYSGMHLYVIRIQTDKVKKSHRQIFEEMRKAGIGVNLHYIPVHTQPYYSSLGFKSGDYPEAELYYTEAISLPLYPDLTEEEHEKIVDNLARILEITKI